MPQISEWQTWINYKGVYHKEYKIHIILPQPSYVTTEQQFNTDHVIELSCAPSWTEVSLPVFVS